MKFFVLLAFSLLGKFVCMAQADSATVTAPPKTADAVVKEKATVLLYPNPTKNKAELQLTGLNPEWYNCKSSVLLAVWNAAKSACLLTAKKRWLSCLRCLQACTM